MVATLLKRVLLLMTLENLARVEVNAENLTIVDAFNNSRIVPDVIPAAPETMANVTFPSGAVMNIGAELTPTQVKDVPIVSWEYNPSYYYTVLMTDPDIPRILQPDFLHWLVVNIPGQNTTAGTTVAPYVGAAPPPGTGLHRYVVLVYQQPKMLTFNETLLNNTSTYMRLAFSSSKFAEKYNLTQLVAGNFYYAKFDSYVPILLKQLGISRATGLQPQSIVLCLLLVFFYVR